MGLSTDSIFIAALSASEDVMQAIDSRLYGTAIPLPDKELENAPVPYIIVSFVGLTNGDTTKDDLYESPNDKVQIDIDIVGQTLGQLHDLTQMVRDVVLDYFKANTTNIENYQFKAGRIIYDPDKPCYWQVLSYECDVYQQIYEQEDN